MREPQVNLICLPFAGGSAYSYADLEKLTASFVKVLPIELPGRGRRFAEPLLTDLHEMARDALEQAREAITARPYALFGHSLGAKLAYVLTRRIIREGFPAPAHLFLSGCAAPSVPPKSRHRHLLPREAFLEMINELGGTPREVLREEGLMDLFEPILRADFQANDTYSRQDATGTDTGGCRTRGPLTQPLTVMIGTKDSVSYEEALKWRDETSGKTKLLALPGRHFFIFDHWKTIGRIISETLEYLAPQPPRP
jgi:surfactin synthase thioesterase subunit